MGSSRQAWAGAALGFAAVVLFAFRDGGYDDPASWRAATVALLAVAGLAFVLRPPARPSRLALLMLLGLAAFAGWTALSALWSSDPDASLVEAQRAVLYLALVAAALAVGGWLLAGTVGGIGFVCAYAVGDRIVHGTPEFDPFEGTLLHEPLGYANALAGLAAIGLAVAVVLALRPRWRLPALALGALFSPRSRSLAAGAAGSPRSPAAPSGSRWRLGRRRVAAATGVTAALLLALALVLPSGGSWTKRRSAIGDRAWYWHVAWQQAGESAACGPGSGHLRAHVARAAADRRVRPRRAQPLRRDPRGARPRRARAALARARPAALRCVPRTTSAAAGAYVAFLLHAGADWDWEMPAVTVAGLSVWRRSFTQRLRNGGAGSITGPQ